MPLKSKTEIKFPTPHKGQQQVLNSEARFKVLCCGRRWGKTLISQIISILAMLKNEHVAYVCPEFGLAKDFYKEVNRFLPPYLIETNNKSELYIELKKGGSIKFFSGEALDNFRGRKYHKVIIDEAAHVPNLEDFWDSAIRPTLADYRGEAIFISTPRGKNFFYSLFLKGLNKEGGFESFRFKSSDNPYFPPEEFEEIQLTVAAAKFREEYLAIPEENSSNPFSQKTITENTIERLSLKPSIVYAIDVAKSTDYSVILGLDEDGCLSHFERFQIPWEGTMNRIRLLPAEIPKIMDSTGVGDAVFEMLYDVENLHGFKFTMVTKPQIMTLLIKEAEMGKLKWNKEIAREMEVFEYIITKSGYIRYEAQSGFHDDCICALAIANFHKNAYINSREWKLYTV